MFLTAGAKNLRSKKLHKRGTRMGSGNASAKKSSGFVMGRGCKERR